MANGGTSRERRFRKNLMGGSGPGHSHPNINPRMSGRYRVTCHFLTHSPGQNKISSPPFLTFPRRRADAIRTFGGSDLAKMTRIFFCLRPTSDTVGLHNDNDFGNRTGSGRSPTLFYSQIVDYHFFLLKRLRRGTCLQRSPLPPTECVYVCELLFPNHCSPLLLFFH